MSAPIALRNVVKTYKRGKESVPVLHGLNLEIPAGQFTKWRGGHVGFIFQFYNLMPMLSAAGNVELPLLLTNLSKAERARRVDVALEIVGLKERAKHKP